MAQPQGIVGVFDRAADVYDAVGVPWFGPIAAGLVAELDVRPGERVLDIGCGRGAALRPLALATGPGGRAVGIDLAPRMVELTARDLAAFSHVEVVVGDARAPGFAAASFDVVAASLVLFFLPDPVAALDAWSALLVPGGRLGVTTIGSQDERWRRVDELFLPYLPPAMLHGRASGLGGPFGSDRGMEELLAGAGLADVRTVSRTVEAVLRDPDHLVEFSWSHGQRAMWEVVPPEAHDEIHAQLVALAGSITDASGRLALGGEIRYTLGARPAVA